MNPPYPHSSWYSSKLEIQCRRAEEWSVGVSLLKRFDSRPSALW
jgi:hypothetical protein